MHKPSTSGGIFPLTPPPSCGGLPGPSWKLSPADTCTQKQKQKSAPTTESFRDVFDVNIQSTNTSRRTRVIVRITALAYSYVVCSIAINSRSISCDFRPLAEHCHLCSLRPSSTILSSRKPGRRLACAGRRSVGSTLVESQLRNV